MRLFIAMPLPSIIEEALAKIIFDLKQNRSGVRWVKPQNIHLTLKFLGETDESKVKAIGDVIEKVSKNYNTLSGKIDIIGGFPNLKRPRVIWAGMSNPIEILAEIAEAIEDELEELGFEKEKRKFKSHLTLGRVKDSFGLPGLVEVIKNYKFMPEELKFDRIVLFKSTLTPGGPIYERLLEAELQK